MSNLFLFFSLFVPRISLLIAYLTASIPLNPVPFFADVILTILVPRILILIYIYVTLGIQSPWFWVHLIFACLAYLGGRVKVSSSSD